MPEKLLVHEAAAILGVHPDTLRRHDRRGTLPAKRDRLGRRVYGAADIKEARRFLGDEDDE